MGSSHVFYAAIAVISMLLACSTEEPGPPVDDTPPVDLVNPYIGSGGKLAGVGSTSVTATIPFGMAKPGPDTTNVHGDLPTDHFSGYYYFDKYVNGFSQVHIHGTGATDYGALLLMPTRGFDANKTTEKGYRAAFSKENEIPAPGHYTVTLEDPEIKAELTASLRAAVHRYTFSAPGKEDHVVIDLGHALWDCWVSEARVEVDAKSSEVFGWLRYKGSLTGRYGGIKLHFVARFNRSFDDWTLWQEEGQLMPKAASAEAVSAADKESVRVGAAVRVDSKEPVEVQVALSYVDLAGARNNLEKELSGKDFDDVQADARAAWSEALDSVKVEGGTKEERVIFYTGLYFAMFTPTTFSDADGRYPGLDGQVHQAKGFSFYSDLTLWDTYRTVHPLYILIQPRIQHEIVLSFIKMLEQGGRLPKCPVGPGYGSCMISTPADTIIAETYLKGITDFDVDKAYAAMKVDATTALPSGGRDAVEEYAKLGYVPGDDVNGSTARTLENGIADAAIARLAKKLGHAQDAQQLEKQAKSYENLWDPVAKFIRGKRADGTWLMEPERFEPVAWEGGNGEYIEGTAWQYLWLVPHDPAGLSKLLGGDAAMVDKLETFFSSPETNYVAKKLGWRSYYWHGNEPDIHAAYLFAAVGAPDRTQYWVRHTMKDAYSTEPDGLAGNDDCGTLASWYVFSAAGFYPIAGQTHYYIGSPVFRRTSFKLGDGKTLEVIAENASEENLYVQSARLNGEPLDQPRFEHDAIKDGGKLELVMGPEPSAWGKGK
jgi:predicted alpha-1,2-mannosidase